MAHPAGERLRCDECGAEVMFVKPCNCTGREGAHSDICCGKPMRNLGVQAAGQAGSPGAGIPVG